MKIEINDLTIGYLTAQRALPIQSDINGWLKSGEFVCLLGPNGAGKTTLLRTLSGFLPALAGNIIIGDRHIGSYSVKELAKTIGVVLTERPSVSAMTVEQLVGMGRSPYTGFWGRLTDKDRESINAALNLSGAAKLADRLVDTLSDGERQRVMIAKALAQDTKAIFLDEPTAFLDFPSKVEIMRLLRDLARERNIIIFQSTHDLNMALHLADRIWLVDNQHGVRIGTPKELADSGDFATYFNAPGLEFDSGRLDFIVR